MNIKNIIRRKKSVISKVGKATKIINEVNCDQTNTSALHEAYSKIDEALTELICMTLDDIAGKIES